LSGSAAGVPKLRNGRVEAIRALRVARSSAVKARSQATNQIKALIITGGFNVAPTEVEGALRQHPDVVDAAVVGLPSDHSGEEVVAAIVVDPGKDVDVEAIREFARGILTPYKVPRRIFVVDELPKSLIGKVLRRQVKERLVALTSGS